MEDVLAVYERPYDADYPVVCMDESNKQLVGEVHEPIPMAVGHGEIVDHEYVRNGVADIFVAVEPLTGQRHVEITERRTRNEFAHFIKHMLDERYPNAVKVRLVMDNLSTHDTASLYATFKPAEARRLGSLRVATLTCRVKVGIVATLKDPGVRGRSPCSKSRLAGRCPKSALGWGGAPLADRLDIHYTPKHGSWLNLAEIEFRVMQSQCLNRRIPNLATMRAEVAAWEAARNNRGAPINWQFTHEKARLNHYRL